MDPLQRKQGGGPRGPQRPSAGVNPCGLEPRAKETDQPIHLIN